MIKKFSKPSLLIAAVLIFFGLLVGGKVWAIECAYTIKDFNVLPNSANVTDELTLKVTMNRSGFICTIGKTVYMATFYYLASDNRLSIIDEQETYTLTNGDTEIVLTVIPTEAGINRSGTYKFFVEVESPSSAEYFFSLKSAPVVVNIVDAPRQKFSCNQNNQCVSDQAGRYPTQADCQKECGKSKGKDGGRTTDGEKETVTREKIIFENPIANDDLISLVKSIAAWIYKLAIPVAVVAIIYGGGLLMLSQGNTKMIDRGRKTLLYAVIGLVIIFIGKGFFILIRSILELGR